VPPQISLHAFYRASASYSTAMVNQPLVCLSPMLRYRGHKVWLVQK